MIANQKTANKLALLSRLAFNMKLCVLGADGLIMQTFKVCIFATTTIFEKQIDYQSQCEHLKIIKAMQVLNHCVPLGIPRLQKGIDNLKGNRTICDDCR